jgi:HAMP domain-containing protein
MTTINERRDRRRRLPMDDARQPRNVFRRILLAEIFVVSTTAVLTLLLGYFLFSSKAHVAPTGYRAVFFGLAFVIVMAVAAVFAAVRVSHRICGPMGKIRSALEQISLGSDPGPISVRRDDDLYELVEALNGAMQEIRRQRAEGLITPPVTAEILALVNQKLLEEAESEFGTGGRDSRGSKS